MLKGVNKLIVEINNPESDYFERAIFFVKPSKGDIPTIELSDNAGALIKNAAFSLKRKKKKKRSYLLALLRLMCAAGLGALIAVIIIKMI